MSTRLYFIFSRIVEKRSTRKASLYYFLPEKLVWLFLMEKVQPFPSCKMTKHLKFDNLFPPYEILTKTCGRMTTAITFSRQNDVDSQVSTT